VPDRYQNGPPLAMLQGINGPPPVGAASPQVALASGSGGRQLTH
jgi:hypothetical protein